MPNVIRAEQPLYPSNASSTPTNSSRQVTVTMTFADYIFWNFLGMCAVILPASWHWRARNVATFTLICWLFLANLVGFVDCIVWNDRFTDLNPVWSDIGEPNFRTGILLRLQRATCSPHCNLLSQPAPSLK